MIGQIGAGSGYTPGVPIKDIDTFIPSSIPGVVLWIKADPKYIKREPIQSYCDRQSYFVKEALYEKFKGVLHDICISEIVSDTEVPNSLVPLLLDTSVPSIFPELRVIDNELDAINMSNYKDPSTGARYVLQMVSSGPVDMETSTPSVFTISHGITLTKNSITNQIILNATFIEEPSASITSDVVPKVLAEPSAEFSEIIIFSRKLSPEDTATMEGYMAYRQNTQYALPSTHPYLPNMIHDPIFSTLAQKLQSCEQNIKAAASRLEIVAKDYLHEKGTHAPNSDATMQTLTTALNTIAMYVTALSKGYLYARRTKNLTYTGIQAAIHEKGWSTITNIDAQMETWNVIVKDTTAYLETLMGAYTAPFTLAAQVGGSQTNAASEISDYRLFTEISAESAALYNELRVQSDMIKADGVTAYSSLQNALKDDCIVLRDTVVHTHSDMLLRASKIAASFAPLETSILSGKWLTYLPTFDTSTENPVINTIQRYYVYVRAELDNGEYAYIISECKTASVYASALCEQDIQPIFRTTYITYLNHLCARVAKYFTQFKSMSAELEKIVKNIDEFITAAKETGQALVFTDAVQTHAPSMPTDIYIRKVAPIDTLLLGLDCVVTDSNGSIPDSKIIPFFTEIAGYTFVNSTYVKTSPYGAQTYHLLPPYAESVYNGFPSITRTPIYTHALNSLYEISRDTMNSIYCVSAEGTVEPLLLPSIGVENGTWVVIYNTGSMPIAIRNPGTPDSIDVAGHGQGFLYIYIKGTCLYGRRTLTPEQIPYDTVTNMPRTSLCMYIDELGTSIYIRTSGKGYEPLYTEDGYLVEAAQTNVYDIDDVYKTNPYTIKKIDVSQRTNLVFNPKHKKMIKLLPTHISMATDTNTQLGILVNEKGAICVNEFGFCSCIRTPIQIIGSNYTLRGSKGDILLKPTNASVTQPYPIEPFIKFENVYQTRFVSNTGTNTVYVTNTLYPIVSPSGKIIEVSPSPVIGELVQMNRVNIPQDFSCAPYTYVNTDDAVKKISGNMLLERLRLRYTNMKLYIQSEIGYMNKVKPSITKFSVDAGNLCTSSIETYTTVLESIGEYDSQIHADTNNPELLVASIDENLTAKMTTFFDTRKKGRSAIDLYLQGIKEIENVKQTIMWWRNDGKDAVNREISLMEDTVQKVAQKHGVTSVSGADGFLKRAIQNQTEFNSALQVAINFCLVPPTLISEVHGWYTTAHKYIDNVSAIADTINIQYTHELKTLINTYERNMQSANDLANVQKILGEIQTSWANIHSESMALDTTIKAKAGQLSPEQLQAASELQQKIDSHISDGDGQISSMYRDTKKGPFGPQLLTNVNQLKTKIETLRQMVHEFISIGLTQF